MISSDDIAEIENKSISGPAENELFFRIFSQNGDFIALAKKGYDKNCFHPFLVLDSLSSIH
jgi:hypothetical protein